MEWTLCLVGMGVDGQSRSFEVMAISRPDDLGDIANLGLTLAEAKLLLAHVQQQLVAGQANTHAGIVTLTWRVRREARVIVLRRVRLPFGRMFPAARD